MYLAIFMIEIGYFAIIFCLFFLLDYPRFKKSIAHINEDLARAKNILKKAKKSGPPDREVVKTLHEMTGIDIYTIVDIWSSNKSELVKLLKYNVRCANCPRMEKLLEKLVEEIFGSFLIFFLTVFLIVLFIRPIVNILFPFVELTTEYLFGPGLDFIISTFSPLFLVLMVGFALDYVKDFINERCLEACFMKKTLIELLSSS